MGDVDTARRVVRDTVGDAPEQVATDPRHAAVTDDDEVRADLFGHGEESVRRFPQASNRGGADAGPRKTLPRPTDDLLCGDALVVAEPFGCRDGSPHRP